MQDQSQPDALLRAVEGLRRNVDALTLPLELRGVDEARREARSLVEQLDDYVLPRLRSWDAPLLAVVGGSTGAGKSTLVSSLVEAPVSRSGVLRPTTRSPVLVHHPDDAGWFRDQRVLPGLRRVFGPEPAGGADEPIRTVQLAESDSLPAGLALLDAPDIDSVVAANRTLAVQLLAAADLWLFVTTAARYADAVPWELLQDASERGASVAVVLDRVPPEALDEVRLHLASMMRERGLSGSPLFTVTEDEVDADGLLQPGQVRPVRSWLIALARDAQARRVVTRRTLTGALRTVGPRAQRLARSADAQHEAHEALAAAVVRAHEDALRAVDTGLSDGSLLRGEVLARWQEFVGTGEMLRNLEARVGRWRDRLTSALRGRPAPDEDMREALQSEVERLLVAEVELAAANTWQQWRLLDGGAALSAAHPELDGAAVELPDEVARTIRDWQGFLLELVRSQGAERRATARALSFGVNGLGVLLMLVVFSQTAGLTGAEIGIAGGTAVVAQKLLEAVFGDQAVRALAAQARADLLRRCGELLERDRARFDAVLAGLPAGVGGEPLRDAAAEVAAADLVSSR